MEDIFYNTNGSTKAYKKNIKHISSAEAFGYGKYNRVTKMLLVQKDISVIDINTMEIKVVKAGEKILVKDLKTL